MDGVDLCVTYVSHGLNINSPLPGRLHGVLENVNILYINSVMKLQTEYRTKFLGKFVYEQFYRRNQEVRRNQCPILKKPLNTYKCNSFRCCFISYVVSACNWFVLDRDWT